MEHRRARPPEDHPDHRDDGCGADRAAPNRRDGADVDDPAARHDDLFDAYLDMVLSGGDEPATAFLARAEIVDDDLADRLDAIRAARRRGPPSSSTLAAMGKGTGFEIPAGAADTAVQREPPGHSASGSPAPPVAPADDGWTGRLVGGFRIERLIGEGGMGMVFRAIDLSLDRPVALKLLRPGVAGARAAAARFEREGRTVARLRHPNIVALYSAGAVDGVCFLAMELIDGTPLDELLRRAAEDGATMPAATVIRWGQALADALHCAHRGGVVHRDVKSSNVLIAADGRPMLVDFGIARAASTTTDEATAADRRSTVATLTEGLVGSPHAMAPERIGRRRAGAIVDDIRSDVYGLGVLLWECLAGRPPFEGDSLEDLFRAILSDDPPPLRSIRPDIPRDLATVVAAAMAKDPARRYATAAALRDDLGAILEFRPIRARPEAWLDRWRRRMRRRPALAAGVAIAALSAVAAFGALAVQRAAHEARRRTDAARAVDEAAQIVDGLRAESDGFLGLAERFDTLAERRLDRHLSEEEDAALDELERSIVTARRDRAERFDRAAELLAAAERLDAAPGNVRRIRADMHFERHREAERREDRAAADTFRRLVEENDVEGRYREALSGAGRLSVTVDAPDARAWLYRIVSEADAIPDGEPRSVAVPVGAEPPIAPGTWALRVVRDSAPLRRGDLIVDIDGEPVERRARREGVDGAMAAAGLASTFTIVRDGPPTELVRDGVDIDPGALDLTTRPLPALAAAVLLPPIEARPIEPGVFLLLVRAPGRAEWRVPFVCRPGSIIDLRIELPPDDWAPAGFVPVPADVGANEAPIWIMQREVTMDEYLQFVRDVDPLGPGGAVPLRHVPRSVAEGPHCVRGDDGRYELPEGATPRWPALGISWQDAADYAAWRSARAAHEGRPWRFALPTHEEWLRACGAGLGSTFVFGDSWRPRWTCSVFAHPTPNPAPVRSFPIDESIFGIHDLAGSASEYVDSWWREDVGYRRHAGGSWAEGGPGSFGVYAANGRPPHAPSDAIGLRLVLRPVPDPEAPR